MDIFSGPGWLIAKWMERRQKWRIMQKCLLKFILDCWVGRPGMAVLMCSSRDQLSDLDKGQPWMCLEVWCWEVILDIWKLVSGTLASNNIFNKSVQGWTKFPLSSRRNYHGLQCNIFYVVIHFFIVCSKIRFELLKCMKLKENFLLQVSLSTSVPQGFLG